MAGPTLLDHVERRPFACTCARRTGLEPDGFGTLALTMRTGGITMLCAGMMEVTTAALEPISSVREMLVMALLYIFQDERSTDRPGSYMEVALGKKGYRRSSGRCLYLLGVGENRRGYLESSEIIAPHCGAHPGTIYYPKVAVVKPRAGRSAVIESQYASDRTMLRPVSEA